MVLIAKTLPKLQELVDRVHTESEKAELYLNAKKKVMKIKRHAADNENDQNIWITNEKIENVQQFIYLGALFINNYYDTPEIREDCLLLEMQQSPLPKYGKIKEPL